LLEVEDNLIESSRATGCVSMAKNPLAEVEAQHFKEVIQRGAAFQIQKGRGHLQLTGVSKQLC